MSDGPMSAPLPPAYVPPAPQPYGQTLASTTGKPRMSKAAVTAIILAALEIVALLTIRTLAAGLGASDKDLTSVTTVLGVLGLASIAWIVATIVFGHIGARKRVERGRLISSVALGVGYLMLLIWFNRLILATIVSADTNDWPHWVSQNFWWA